MIHPLARVLITLRMLPIEPVERNTPVIAQNRWQQIERNDITFLKKTYEFRSLKERNLFINDLFLYEISTRHQAKITIEDDSSNVTVEIHTKNVDVVTEVDREMASFLDLSYKDVCYK